MAADLPAKQEQVLEVELASAAPQGSTRPTCSGNGRRCSACSATWRSNRFEIFRSLTLLRQLSLDAGLVDDAHAGPASTKLDALLDQLQDVAAEGHRALVFSQFTRFLGRSRERLDAAGIAYCYLDGSTRDRAAVVRRVQGRHRARSS